MFCNEFFVATWGQIQGGYAMTLNQILASIAVAIVLTSPAAARELTPAMEAQLSTGGINPEFCGCSFELLAQPDAAGNTGQMVCLWLS